MNFSDPAGVLVPGVVPTRARWQAMLALNTTELIWPAAFCDQVSDTKSCFCCFLKWWWWQLLRLPSHDFETIITIIYDTIKTNWKDCQVQLLTPILRISTVSLQPQHILILMLGQLLFLLQNAHRLGLKLTLLDLSMGTRNMPWQEVVSQLKLQTPVNDVWLTIFFYKTVKMQFCGFFQWLSWRAQKKAWAHLLPEPSPIREMPSSLRCAVSWPMQFHSGLDLEPQKVCQ